MLQALHIENYALIVKLSIEFGTGLNLMTGETGSGKSIVVDALGLLLGGKGSADLIRAFHAFYQNPRQGEVYNIGGGRFSNCSMLEAIALCEEISGNRMRTQYVEENRIGDHIWWVSDVAKFRTHFPDWHLTKNVRDILREIYEANIDRWGGRR